MKDLLSELMQARYRAAGGAMDEAQKHIDEALELLEDALGRRPGPKPSIRAIRGYLDEAHSAVKNDDSKRAVAALGSALEAIEGKLDETSL
jgi:hypothetical protein